MSDLLEVFSRGDHFGTYAADGRILVWTVVSDGLVKLQPGPVPEVHGPRWPGDSGEWNTNPVAVHTEDPR
jgi:hypothetical protein